MRYLFLLLLVIGLRVEAINFSNGSTTINNARTVELNGVPLTGSSANGDANYEFSNYLSNITGLIDNGANITLSGSGTSGSPYVITGFSRRWSWYCYFCCY